MMHGTIIQILHGGEGVSIIIIQETVLFNTLLLQWDASHQQQSATNNEQRWVLSLTLAEIIVPSSP